MTERTELTFVQFPSAIRRPQRRQFPSAKTRTEAGRAVVPGHRAAAEQPETPADKMLRVSAGGIDRYKRTGVFGYALKHLAELFVVEMVQKQVRDVEMPLAVA